MNSLEKKSFYSFLGLYIISSVLFILLSGYLYNSAQINTLEKNEYYRLQHIADKLSNTIIHSHMKEIKLVMPKFDDDVNITLINTNNKVVFGKLLENYPIIKADYINNFSHNILISDAPQEHLDIKFVVVYSQLLNTKINSLKRNIIAVMLLSIFIIIVLAWILSKLFMRPIQKKIQQIEDFVHDTAHELNTPITALGMSVTRALKKESYDKKTLKNISISTKQLFDIYNALSYLSFDSTPELTSKVNVCKVLEKSVAYYQELAQSKMIDMEVKCEEFEFIIDETKLTMLFGNLINNAIKYSNPSSRIIIILKNSIFSIQDFGIGIQKDKLDKIYDRFNRETEHAGGFGIGLNIVKKISDEYNLNLEVESKLNKGTTFFINFRN